MQSSEHLKALLWTVACSMLFFWFFSVIVRDLNQPYITRVQHVKVCPAQPPIHGVP